jgi:hypothetical protein
MSEINDLVKGQQEKFDKGMRDQLELYGGFLQEAMGTYQKSLNKMMKMCSDKTNELLEAHLEEVKKQVEDDVQKFVSPEDFSNAFENKPKA